MGSSFPPNNDLILTSGETTCIYDLVETIMDDLNKEYEGLLLIHCSNTRSLIKNLAKKVSVIVLNDSTAILKDGISSGPFFFGYEIPSSRIMECMTSMSDGVPNTRVLRGISPRVKIIDTLNQLEDRSPWKMGEMYIPAINEVTDYCNLWKRAVLSASIDQIESDLSVESNRFRVKSIMVSELYYSILHEPSYLWSSTFSSVGNGKWSVTAVDDTRAFDEPPIVFRPVTSICMILPFIKGRF